MAAVFAAAPDLVTDRQEGGGAEARVEREVVAEADRDDRVGPPDRARQGGRGDRADVVLRAEPAKWPARPVGPDSRESGRRGGDRPVWRLHGRWIGRHRLHGPAAHARLGAGDERGTDDRAASVHDAELVARLPAVEIQPIQHGCDHERRDRRDCAQHEERERADQGGAGPFHRGPPGGYSFWSASTSRSMWLFSWAAEIWQRSLACPSGTTGEPKPMTKTPSSRRRLLMAMALAVSPTMIGQMAVGLSRTLKPAALIFCLA